MKKKLTRYITMFVLALQGLTITSCSDWLDLMPNDGVPLDEFWKTKEDVRSVLNGAYLSMASSAMVQRLFLYGEWRADMITSGKRTNSNVLLSMRLLISVTQYWSLLRRHRPMTLRSLRLP